MKQMIALCLLMTVSLSANATMPVVDFASILQLETQVKLIRTQINVLSENGYDWSNAQNLINQLGDLVKQKDMLAYNSANMNEKFQDSYPGYKAPVDFNQQYKANVNITQHTLNGVLQSMGASAKDFEDENRRLKFIQKQAQSSKGQLEAIQASAQISSEMVSQLQLLRHTMIAQASAQNAYYATTIQTQASAQAELTSAISKGSTNVPKYGSSGHYLTTPNFGVYDKK